MNFNIRMGIPEMQELWLDLQEKYRSGNIKKKEEQLYKKWLLEYMWDVFTGNPKFKKELEELKEARFDDVCSVKECDEQGNVIPYNGEYEPEGR